MSRLYDRVLAKGCRPWRFSDWPARPVDPRDPAPPVGDFPIALERLDLAMLDGAFVLAADDVVRYLDRHADDLRSLDIITNVAPPLPRMFIEFQATGRYRERHGLNAWAVLVDGQQMDEPTLVDEGVRWGLKLRVIFEPRKGDVCGPIGITTLFARTDGTLDRVTPNGVAIGGHEWARCRPDWLNADDSDPFVAEMQQALWELMVPALFAVSLMHSRNVTAAPVDPPTRKSHAFQRRNGRPLSRYHVLNIEPMREERQPADSTWHDLLASEGIELVWLERFANFVRALS